jgi:nitrate reductase NapE
METAPDAGSERRREFFAFLFLTVVLVPLLAVSVVGGYGLLVWIIQIILGPPGPPGG